MHKYYDMDRSVGASAADLSKFHELFSFLVLVSGHRVVVVVTRAHTKGIIMQYDK